VVGRWPPTARRAPASATAAGHPAVSGRCRSRRPPNRRPGRVASSDPRSTCRLSEVETQIVGGDERTRRSGRRQLARSRPSRRPTTMRRDLNSHRSTSPTSQATMWSRPPHLVDHDRNAARPCGDRIRNELGRRRRGTSEIRQAAVRSEPSSAALTSPGSTTQTATPGRDVASWWRTSLAEPSGCSTYTTAAPPAMQSRSRTGVCRSAPAPRRPYRDVRATARNRSRAPPDRRNGLPRSAGRSWGRRFTTARRSSHQSSL
jgi:hypothetical protein